MLAPDTTRAAARQALRYALTDACRSTTGRRARALLCLATGRRGLVAALGGEDVTRALAWVTWWASMRREAR